MKEQIQSLIRTIEREPTNEEVLLQLEEIVTEDHSAEDEAHMVEELESGWRGLFAQGRFKGAACALECLIMLIEDENQQAEMFRELARMQETELFDQKAAITSYKKAAAVLNSDSELLAHIEELESQKENWQEIVNEQLADAESAPDDTTKAGFLFSAAAMTYRNHKRGKDIPDQLWNVLDLDPRHLRAARLLEKVLEERERWTELVGLYRSLADRRESKDEIVKMLLLAAYTAAYREEDKSAAAELYVRVLDYRPGYQTALSFLVEYYESQEDWDHLVAVYEDGLRGQLTVEDEMAMLMQVGMVHWKMRQDLDAAENYFRQLRRHDKTHQGMVNFYRTYCEEKSEPLRLLKVLKDAQRETENKAFADELVSEIAKLAAKDGGNLEKQIDAWKAVMRKEPGDNEAREKLKDLYRQAEKWNALLDLLKGEVEALPAEDADGKVAVLSEIAEIYREHLSLETMVINTYKSIMELAPANREVQDALAEAYEREGRWNDMINILQIRADSAEDESEKVELLNRAAGLWIERFNNFNKAVGPLEQILQIDPQNRDALDTLRSVYERKRAWRQLLALYQKEIEFLEDDERIDRLRLAAGLATERLNDHRKAVELWQQVLKFAPDDEQALDSLEGLTERLKDWAVLCDVLEKRAEQMLGPDEAIKLLSKLGTVAKDRLRDPVRSAKAWRQIIDLQPGHAKAMRSLKEAYLDSGDWDALEQLYRDIGDFEGLIEVFGIAADRTKDAELKTELSFRCARLYEDELAQPDRALRHYERVLSVDDTNEKALRALVEIYRRSDKWNKLKPVLELLLEHTVETSAQLELFEELRTLCSEKLNSKTAAFEWAVRIFKVDPQDPVGRETFERSAEEARKFEEMIAIYREHLNAYGEDERLELMRHMATLTLQHVGSIDAAVELYKEILEIVPDDVATLDALDELYRSSGRFAELETNFQRRLEMTDDDWEKRRLRLELATLYEDALDDAVRSIEQHQKILELYPEDRESIGALERLLAAFDRHEELVAMLNTRRELPDASDDEWREVTFKIAELYEKRLEQQAEAIATYRAVLERFSGDEGAVNALDHFLRIDQFRQEVALLLEPHLYETADWRRLAWVLAIQIDNTSDIIDRLDLHVRLAEIYSDNLEDSRAAYETLGAALKEHTANVDLWNRMTAFAQTLELRPDLVDRLSEAYRSGKLSEDLELELAERLVELLVVELERPAAAETYLRRLIDADPGHELAFQTLESSYSSEERWEDLRYLYERVLDADVSDEQRLEVLLKVCFLVDEVQHEVAPAIEAYQSVLDLVPDNNQAIRALLQLYEEAKKWPELSELLMLQLELAPSEELVGLRYRLGEVYELRLGKPDEAIEYYEQVLLEDGNHLKAQQAMERLLEDPRVRGRCARILSETYENQGAAEPLAKVLMIHLEGDELDDHERIEILVRVADLRERRLGRAADAFEVHAQAIAIDPMHELVRGELTRLATQLGIYERYAEVLEGMNSAVSDYPSDQMVVLGQLAQIYDEQLGDSDKALEAYRRLLEVDRGDEENVLCATGALDRLLGAQERWPELLEVLRIRTDAHSDTMERKEIIHRMAEIEESILEHAREAIDLCREILSLDEMDARAVLSLERLYEHEKDWPNLVEVLRMRVGIESDHAVRRDLLLRVASIVEKEIGDPDTAIEAYTEVGNEVGPDRAAAQALMRLYKRAEKWPELLETYEMEMTLVESDSERVTMLFEMGKLLCGELAEVEQGVARFGELLAIDPNHGGTREALEQQMLGPAKLEAVAILEPLYEVEQNYEKLLQILELKVDESEDSFERAALMQQAASIAQDGLDDAARAFGYLSRAFRESAESPDLAGLIDQMESYAAHLNDFGKLMADYREAAPEIIDGDLQIRCYLRVAELAGAKLNDLEIAREYYVKVLDISGENETAIAALVQIYESTKQYVELFEIYRRQLQNMGDPDRRLELLFKQARICEEHLDDVAGATGLYEAILEESYDNAEAMNALERLYPLEERWADLIELIDRRTETAGREKAELLHRLGTLTQDKLGDDERAIDYFRAAMEVNPGYEPTLAILETAMEDEARRGQVAELLEPIYKARGDWAKLIDVLEARFEFSDDSYERKELLRAIGTTAEEQLGDLERAFTAFGQLFREDVEDKQSWDLISRMAQVLEAWDRLAEVYAGALDDVVGDTPTTAELAYILGEIYETKLARPDDAKAAYRRVLAFAPDDPKAFASVERMLLTTESWNDLLGLYRDAADAAIDLEQRREFLVKIAHIQEQRNEDFDAAIDAFRSVLEIEEFDANAIAQLDRLYPLANRYDDLTSHLRSQIDMASEVAERNRLRVRLAEVYEKHLDDPSTAVDMHEEAISEEGGGIADSVAALERLIMVADMRTRIAEVLEPIYRETDEWKKLIVILKTHAEATDNADDKVENYREIAALHELRGENMMLAFRSLSKAFWVEPNEREILTELVRLTQAVGSWDELASNVETKVEEIYDEDFKAEVLGLLGSVYDKQLDLPRNAIDAYRKVLELDDAHEGALDALEALYNLVGDWQGLVGILEQKSNLVSDPAAQAALLRGKAKIHEELMAEPENAVDAYRQSLDTEPDSLEAITALERLLEEQKQWMDLVDIRRQHLEVVADAVQQLELQKSIARVFQNQLDDAFEAVSAWRQALDLEPHDWDAISALDHLYQKEENHQDLLEILVLQKEIVQDQAMWVDVGLRIGALQETELSDMGGAVDAFRDVLAQQPTNATAIEALERLASDESVRMTAIGVLAPLHHEAGRFDNLARLLEMRLELLDDPAERFEQLMSIAEIHEVERSAPQEAFEVYARALAEDTSRLDVVETLEQIAGAEGLWQRLAEVLDERVDSAYDADVERTLLTRIGEVRETHLSDDQGAVDAFRRAYDAGGMETSILTALDRLYTRTSQWNELEEILEQEVNLAASEDERVAFKLRQGALKQEAFEDLAGAISIYREITEWLPSNDQAVGQLEALLSQDEYVDEVVGVLTPAYVARGDKLKVCELYNHRLRITDNEDDKVILFQELAGYQENELANKVAAFNIYAQAFALTPYNQQLFEECERLAGQNGAYGELVSQVEQVLNGNNLDESLAVELGLKIAGRALSDLQDPAKAEALYRFVIEKDDANQQALSTLADLLRRSERFEELLPILEQLGEAIYDVMEKKEVLFAIAEVALQKLGNAQRAMEAYRAVRESDEADLQATDALIALTEQSGDFNAQVELLLERALHTADISEGNKFRHQAAAVYQDRLDNAERASEVLREVLDSNPMDSEALALLESSYRRQEAWSDLQELLMRKIDAARTDQERADVYVAMADVAQKHFDAPDDAINFLTEVLYIDPLHPVAGEKVEQLYIATERWQDLVEFLEARADRARDAGDVPGELTLLVKIGEIWDERLSDTPQATAIYERVLERDPEHTRALASLARLYESDGDFERCAEVLRRAAASGRGGPDEAEVHYRLALLHENQLDDLAGALNELQLAINQDPTHMAANQRLADYFRENGNPQGLLETLIREEAVLEEAKEKLAKLMEIAQLQESEIGDMAGSVATLERARELVPGDKDILSRLADGYVSAGRGDDAIPVIESLIDAETDGGRKRSKKAAVYHAQLANAYKARGEIDKALKHLQDAYKIDVTNVQVLVALGRLQYEQGDLDQALRLLRALLLQKFDAQAAGITKADVYCLVGEIQLKQGDARKAKAMFQRGLDDQKGHPGCADGLTRCQ